MRSLKKLNTNDFFFQIYFIKTTNHAKNKKPIAVITFCFKFLYFKSSKDENKRKTCHLEKNKVSVTTIKINKKVFVFYIPRPRLLHTIFVAERLFSIQLLMNEVVGFKLRGVVVLYLYIQIILTDLFKLRRLKRAIQINNKRICFIRCKTFLYSIFFPGLRKQ